MKKNIICPKCKKKLIIIRKKIICKIDKIEYKIKNDILIMLNKNI